MKNSVFNFKTVPVWANGMLEGDRTGSLGIPMFDGIMLAKAKDILQSLDRATYYGIIELANNIALEKISWQIYKSPDYWDIILLVNDIDPLFGMPYEYDIVSDSTDQSIERYTRKIYKRYLPDLDRKRLHDAKAEEDSNNNEKHRMIYYIFPDKIYDVRQILYEEGITNVA